MWFLRHHARKFFRSFMKPIPVHVAKQWYQRTRYLYVCLGASSLLYSYYLFKKNQKEIELFPDFDKSSIHKHLRMKGQPGEVVIANIGIGRPMTIERYDNEEYIREYNERKRNYELNQKKAEKMHTKEKI